MYDESPRFRIPPGRGLIFYATCGQGFMAAASMMLLGNDALPATRLTVTVPSSSGWRRISRASR